jgi:hypothetical protein
MGGYDPSDESECIPRYGVRFFQEFDIESQFIIPKINDPQQKTDCGGPSYPAQVFFIKGADNRKPEHQEQKKREDQHEKGYGFDRKQLFGRHMLPLQKQEEFEPFMRPVSKSEPSEQPHAFREFQFAFTHILYRNGYAEKEIGQAVEKIKEAGAGGIRK